MNTVATMENEEENTVEEIQMLSFGLIFLQIDVLIF